MKKNHIAAILLILFITCAALVACSHAHNFEWRYDDNIHWRGCDCGEQLSRERHSYLPDYRYNDEYHFFTCVCGKEGEKEPHNFEGFMFDENSHWKVCKCGAQDTKRRHDFSAQWQTDELSHWQECECGKRRNEESHKFADSVIRTATCSEVGILRHTCSECGKTIDEDITKLPHVFGANYKCLICGEDKPRYTYSEDGQYLYFGKYPQSAVTNENLIKNLNATYDRLPTADDYGKWTSYDYALKGAKEYMWYIDVEHSYNKYRGVYFTEYRPYDLEPDSSIEKARQDDNGYFIENVYWFKFEPIKWRILSQNDGTALIMSDIILDSQAFQTDYFTQDELNGARVRYTFHNGAPKGTYANNYKYSTIREWLNDDFYNGAFDDYERENINLTDVDNSLSTTGLNNPNYICEDTLDYVFLLSYDDCVNEAYGFSHISTEHASRQLKPSAYSLSQGAYAATIEFVGYGWWWTRSPRNTSDLLCGIYSAGRTDSDYRFYLTACGVVPAITIKL